MNPPRPLMIVWLLLEPLAFCVGLFLITLIASIWGAILLVQAGGLLMPVGVAFAAILTAEQRDGRLVIEKNPTVALVFRFWIYCVLATAAFWTWLHLVH